jgi:ABC-type bacteriocin/lantibiotic exporter with double-glycine peptidase domain
VRYQDLSYSCGPAALVNAVRVFGKRIAERRIRGLSGCTEQGTDEDGLIAAARQLGYTAASHWSADQTAAWSFVRANVLDGKPCLLCIDSWGHWVTVVGIFGDHVLLADPANTKKNSSENGLHSLSRRELLKRWRCPNESEPFFAIAVGK